MVTAILAQPAAAAEHAREHVITARGVRFRYPHAIAECIDLEVLEVARGEHLFIHGPSGCGKSTLLSLLGGVLIPQAGSIRLLGQDWAALPAWNRDAYRAAHVGFIFQQFNLLPYLSVMQNVELPCRLSALRHANAQAHGESVRMQAAELLRDVQLERELWSRPASMLSVGQQQRVAAARALIGWPELVLADEPTSSLDEDRRNAFLDLLLRVCTAARSALVFVSHDLRIAERFERRLELPELNRVASRELAS
jgi:putative ABC transport system ATP-binding protein